MGIDLRHAGSLLRTCFCCSLVLLEGVCILKVSECLIGWIAVPPSIPPANPPFFQAHQPAQLFILSAIQSRSRGWPSGPAHSTRHLRDLGEGTRVKGMALRLLKGEIEKAFQTREGSQSSAGHHPPAPSQLKLKERLPSDRRGLKKALQRLRHSQHTSQKTVSALKAPRFKLADPRQYSAASTSGSSASLQRNVQRWLALSAHPIEAEVGRVVQKHNLRLKRASTEAASPESTPVSSVFTDQDFEKWQSEPFLHSPLKSVTAQKPARKKKKSSNPA